MSKPLVKVFGLGIRLGHGAELFNIEPRVFQRLAELREEVALQHDLVKPSVESEQGGICQIISQHRQGLPAGQAHLLALHADAVDQDVVFVFDGLLGLNHDFKAVAGRNRNAARRPIDLQTNARYGQQLRLLSIKPAGLHVQHDPALLRLLSRIGVFEPVKQAHDQRS